MEIVRHQRTHHLELVVEGRLDGYWAQHLSATVGEAMREGSHAVRLNLAKTSYISSAGIGVLVELYKNFQAVNGSFEVTEPSRQVRKVLELVGLAQMLTDGSSAGIRPAAGEGRRIEKDGAVFEVHDHRANASLVCRVMGNPAGLAGAGYTAADCREVELSAHRIALGLGAFGEGFDACRGSFGEYLAVASAAACQSTDGTNFPDYMTASGDFVPRVNSLYGLCCDGEFSHSVRFQGAQSGDPVALSSIMETCLDVAGADSAGVVLIGESAGLMAAALKRAPVEGVDARVFAFPEVRQWISFSPERSYPHALALATGVISKAPNGSLKPLVRPLARRSTVEGHLHAAAFAYRPLQKGRLELQAAVSGLFAAGGLQGVMHLLSDDRETAGGGESEFWRGACWVSPIREVTREESAQ